MFVENSFPGDVRVKNESDLLVAAGYSVVVVSIGRRGAARSEVVDGIQVYRIPRLELFEKLPIKKPSLLQRIRIKLTSVIGYATEYFYFTTACFVLSLYVAAKHGFDAIHAHNPPDTLFLVAFPYRLLGKKYVFDHHDLCPELYRSRYVSGGGLVANVLQMLEWFNLKLANVTIATNESYKRIHIERGGRKPESIFIVRNGPNAARMQISAPNQRLRSLNKTILCYIGSLNPQDGVDYLLRSLAQLRYDLNRSDFHCVIMGNGDSLKDLRQLAASLKLNEHVELTGYVTDQDLQANLAAADICVDPDPSSPLNDVSTWIKIMEYMAAAKPIVTFDLKETRYSAQEAALYVPPNDEMAFAHGIVKLMDNEELREAMGRIGRERVDRELQWAVVGRNLIAAYETLFAVKRKN